MTAFYRLSDGRLFYRCAEPINVGAKNFLLKGYVEDCRYPICVKAQDATPEPGAPLGLRVVEESAT